MHLRATAVTAVAALSLAPGLTGGHESGSRSAGGSRSAVSSHPAVSSRSAVGSHSAGSPGDIVSSSPSSFHPTPGQPTNTQAWHITYRSTTAKGAPNTVSGTVIVPKDGKEGPRPLISYALGTVGLADSCAPSAGFPKGTTVEAALIQRLINRGWAVAVTDYEGLGTPGDHTYTVGRAEGQAVLDAARAALRLPEAAAAGVTRKSPIGIMGYSQGGQAGGWAAELHRSYAPELRVKGTAAGGVPSDLLRLAQHHDGNIGAGLVLMAATGQNAAFPELHLENYLNDRGRRYVDYMKNNCAGVEAVAGLFKRLSEVTVKNPLDQPDWQRQMHASDVGTRTPDEPVYLYHGTADLLIPYAFGKQLRADWCGRGATVQWNPILLGEHAEAAIQGAAPAADWLADRFEDKPTSGNCG
ncbi:lipase family protein [Streptomyces chattanoogensis]